jgi:hypothetical protein
VADFTNGNLTLHDLTVGSPLSVISNHTYYLFPQTAAPELTTTGYYFARTIPGITLRYQWKPDHEQRGNSFGIW